MSLVVSRSTINERKQPRCYALLCQHDLNRNREDRGDKVTQWRGFAASVRWTSLDALILFRCLVCLSAKKSGGLTLSFEDTLRSALP